MTIGSEDVLFVGKNLGVVSWYRTGLPALHLGCDWVSITRTTDQDIILNAAFGRKGFSVPRFEEYKVVILQQPEGNEWAREIKRLKSNGVRVIYEVDDYLHGVREIKSHRAKGVFTKERMASFERCMRLCDAMICSTDWLANEYRQFNENVYVCENGVDGGRYQIFNLPERPTINIGWAGGEGHLESVMAWMPAVEQILNGFPQTRFLSMGLPVAKLLKMPEQAVALPFIALENFPAALTSFDIAIAPAGRGGFFAGKSDLRWMETGALGIPLVADPFVYKRIKDGYDGIHATDVDGVYDALRYLVTDVHARKAMGNMARERVLLDHTMEKSVEQWEKVVVEVAS